MNDSFPFKSPFKDFTWPSIEPEEPLSLRSFSASELAGKPVMARPWLLPNVVPGRQVTLLFGDGAAGKSLLALMLGVAVATATDWIGLTPASGPSVYVGAEDDEEEIHRRLVDIAAAKNMDLAQLSDFHVVPLAGLDAVLAEPEGRGSERLKATRVWDAIVEKVRLIRPRLLVIDTLADAFAGNENSRPQARQFISLLRGLAIEHDLAVVVLAHPSISGMSQGSGTSGSTGWNNSVRSRLYFERVFEEKVEHDPDIRMLTVKKVNYGRVGADFRLRWSRGVFEIDREGAGASDRLAGEARAEQVFLKLLKRLTDESRFVSHKRSPSFAPTIFAKQSEANGCSKDALDRAMERLFAKDQIHVEEHGPPSARTSRIVLGTVKTATNGLGTVGANGLGTGVGTV